MGLRLDAITVLARKASDFKKVEYLIRLNSCHRRVSDQTMIEIQTHFEYREGGLVNLDGVIEISLATFFNFLEKYFLLRA